MDSRKRNILLGVLIVGVISMTVAFAALSTTLNISGTASLPTTKWDIHFANGQDNTPGTHTDGKTNRGTITGMNFAATSITNFTATLYQPNDEVVYNFDIVNAGTIDGQLDNFNKTITCNSSDCSMITYTIDCEDDSHQDANQSDYILASGQSVSCEMKIKYNDQTNTGNGVYTQSAVSATAGATWLYKQVEGNGSSGGNTPTPSGTYGYIGKGSTTDTANGWPTELNPAWNIYMRQNMSTNVVELCGVFPSGTTCLDNNNIYESDFENCDSLSDYDISCITGYTGEKVTEMIENGAECSMPNGNGSVNCISNNNLNILIQSSGLIHGRKDNEADCYFNYINGFSDPHCEFNLN